MKEYFFYKIEKKKLSLNNMMCCFCTYEQNKKTQKIEKSFMLCNIFIIKKWFSELRGSSKIATKSILSIIKYIKNIKYIK